MNEPSPFVRGMAARIAEYRTLVRTTGQTLAARKVQAARLHTLARVLAPGTVPTPPSDAAALAAWFLAADAAIVAAQPAAAALVPSPLAPGLDVLITGGRASKRTTAPKPAPVPRIQAPPPVAPDPLPPPVRAAVTLADLLNDAPTTRDVAPAPVAPAPVALPSDVRADLRDAVAAVQGLTGADVGARRNIARALATLAAAAELHVPPVRPDIDGAGLTEWACDVAALLRPARTPTPEPERPRGPIRLTPVEALRAMRIPETHIRIVSPHGSAYTYELRRPFNDGPIFVHVDTGNGKPAFLGSIFADGEYRHGRKSRIAPDAPEARAFAWVYHAARTDRGFGPVDVYDVTDAPADDATAPAMH